jgi:hypothetical protein
VEDFITARRRVLKASIDEDEVMAVLVMKPSPNVLFWKGCSTQRTAQLRLSRGEFRPFSADRGIKMVLRQP